jgi:hypothetical protein
MTDPAYLDYNATAPFAPEVAALVAASLVAAWRGIAA